MHATEPDPATTNDRYGGARWHTGGVTDGTDTGGHRTPDKRDKLKRRILPHPDRPGLWQDRPLGERGDAQVVVPRLTVDLQPARAIVQHPAGCHHLGGELALGGPATPAGPAPPAGRHPGQHDMITR